MRPKPDNPVQDRVLPWPGGNLLAALKRPDLTDLADVDQDLVVCFGLA
jgi:hypothetical protein